MKKLNNLRIVNHKNVERICGAGSDESREKRLKIVKKENVERVCGMGSDDSPENEQK